jgi:hypothetical protein
MNPHGYSRSYGYYSMDNRTAAVKAAHENRKRRLANRRK